MTLIEKLVEDAEAAPSRRVALPECEAVKTLLAAHRVLDEGVGTPVLVSPRDVIEATAAEAGVALDGMEIVDSADEAAADALAERYMAGGARLLSAKGTRRKIKSPMWYAMVMEELGDVDCTFCGHTNTTGDVLMAAQTIIGLKEGVDVPSIFALVETAGFEGPEGNVICFADCGLNPEPTASELASIAISAADNVAAIMGWEPRVFLGTLGVFFVIRGSLTVILQATAGFYTPEVLGYALYGAPGVILGTLLAFPVAKRIPQETFRKVLLVIIGVAGAVCLVRAFL